MFSLNRDKKSPPEKCFNVGLIPGTVFFRSYLKFYFLILILDPN
jgi:hypothetical protein